MRQRQFKVYLSASHRDGEVINRIVAQLTSAGIQSMRPDDTISPGDNFAARIEEAIDIADFVLTLWSPSSIRSPFILAEAARAVAKEKFLPLAVPELDLTELPAPFNVYQILIVDPDGHWLEKLKASISYLESRRARQFDDRAERKEQGGEDQAPLLGSAEKSGGKPNLPASQQPNVFISYSRKDADACELLFNLLREEGLTPWYDKDIGSGDFKRKIVQRISGASVFALLLSKNSMASGNVSKEMNVASVHNRLIVPISLDGTEPRRVCRRLQILRDWSHEESHNVTKVFTGGA